MTHRKTALSQVVGIGLGVLFPGVTMNAATTSGDAIEVASNIVHANGNIYDQVLLLGSLGTVRADPGQITRVSFLDLTDDIVQVEFSGAGSLTVSLEDASGPMAPAKYNQPGVEYMRGHASIAIAGADATTNVSVFSVGRINAGNQGLFRDGATYDGFADIARIEIAADPTQPAGTSAFGGIRAGNVRFFATQGVTGIYAPAVSVRGPVTVGDISAYDDATPFLWLGDDSPFSFVTVAGGDLYQPNGRAMQMNGFQAIHMASGTSSAGVSLPGQILQGRVENNGFDVTNDVVLYPAFAITTTSLGTTITATLTTAWVVLGDASMGVFTGAAAIVPVAGTAPTTPAPVPIVPVVPGVVVQPGGG